MKQFSIDAVNASLGVYNREVMPNLHGWLASLEPQINTAKIVQMYQALLRHPQWFLAIDDAVYAKIELKLGINTDEKRTLCKKLFTKLYSSTLTNDIKSTLIASLDIDICPYCNMDTLDNYGNVGFRCNLDHFYLKSKFYLFSIFLYNLIPCCHKCNSDTKRQSTTKHVNPYIQDMDSMSSFEISADFHDDFIRNITIPYQCSAMAQESGSFELCLSCKNVCASNTDRVFQLTQRYNSPDPKQELLRTFKAVWANSPETVAHILHEPYHYVYSVLCTSLSIPSDSGYINKQRYSKMKRDILHQTLKKHP